MEKESIYTVGASTAKVLDALQYLQNSVFLIEEVNEELKEDGPQGLMEKYYALHDTYFEVFVNAVKNSPFNLEAGANEI